MRRFLQFWGLLRRHLLSRLWFWILLAASLGAILFGVPVLGAVGQIILGLVLSIFAIPLVWLIVLTTRRSGASFPWVWLIGIAAAVVLAWWIFHLVNRTPPPATGPATSGVVYTAPVTIAPRWSHRTMDIPAQCLVLYLHAGWKDFAFGGAITITTPSGQVLHDTPGVNNQWGFQPDGNYTVCADPIGSNRQVQIYNIW